MQEFNKFINNLKDDLTGQSIAKIGRITKFNPGNMTANIQPLPTKDNTIVLNVPVASIKSSKFNIHVPYEVGDYVLLVYIDNDIDNILLGNSTVNSSRKRDDTDCIAVGGITLLNEKTNGSNNLTISSNNGKANITITEDGNITIVGETVSISSRTDHSTWN